MEIILFIIVFALIFLGIYVTRKIRAKAFYQKHQNCPQCAVPLIRTNVALFNGDTDFSVTQFGRETRHDSNQNIPALRGPKCDDKIALDHF